MVVNDCQDFADTATECGSLRFPLTQQFSFVVVRKEKDVTCRCRQNLTNTSQGQSL